MTKLMEVMAPFDAYIYLTLMLQLFRTDYLCYLITSVLRNLSLGTFVQLLSG